MMIEPWMWGVLIPGALSLLWVLMNLKTSRPDGTILKTHPFRTMLGHIMPTRNESVVYFDSYVLAENLLDYVARAKERFSCDVTHCVVGAVALALAEVPRMNRFVVGRRLYQRNGRWLTFSMKRRKKGREAKLSAVKMEMNEGETFQQLCGRISRQINVERSGAKTYQDKELNLLVVIPRPILNWAVKAARWLDYHNMLPGWFIRGDAMYTSVFIANLGSLEMGPGYHHLFEWGTCPLFMMLGKIEEKPVVEEGQLVIRKVLHIRYSYDERIDDGLNARFGIDGVKRILENPTYHLGCLEQDGSDARSLSEVVEPEADANRAPARSANNL